MGEGKAFYRATRWWSISQGEKTSSLTYPEGEGSNLAVCLCVYVCLVSEGSRFGAPGSQTWAPGTTV